MTAAVAIDRPPPMRVPLWAAVAILACVVIAAYWPVFGAQFSYWDDQDNMQLSGAFDPPTWDSLIQRWSQQHQHIYTPLTYTVWHVLAIFSQTPPPRASAYVFPLAFKIASVVTHLLASAGVLLVLRRLAGVGVGSLGGALLFALHPLQVESVAWTSGLKDELFGLFGAITLFAYLCDRDVDGKPRGRGVIIALAALILAGLSKPTAMVLPVMLLAVDLMHFRRRLAESVTRLTPFILVGVAFAVYARMVQPTLALVNQPPVSMRPLLSIHALAFYLTKLVWPTGLAFDYGQTPQVVAESFSSVKEILTAFAIVGFALLAVVMLRKKWPMAMLAGLLAVLPLAPVLGLVPFDFEYYSLVADHYVYFAMFGVALTIAGFLNVMPLRATPVILIVSAASLVLGVLTFRQAERWRDPAAISRQTLAVNPQSFGSWGNLGLLDLEAGNLDSAEANVRHALELCPNDPATEFLLANILQERGDVPGAIKWVRQAIVTSKFSTYYHSRLADLLGKNGQFDEALAEYEQAVRLDPSNHHAVEMAERTRAFVRSLAATRPTSRSSTRTVGPRS